MPSRSIGSVWFFLLYGATPIVISGCGPREPVVAERTVFEEGRFATSEGEGQSERAPDDPWAFDHSPCVGVDPGLPEVRDPEAPSREAEDPPDPRPGHACPDDT
jgi:hypothetical protein